MILCFSMSNMILYCVFVDSHAELCLQPVSAGVLVPLFSQTHTPPISSLSPASCEPQRKALSKYCAQDTEPNERGRVIDGGKKEIKKNNLELVFQSCGFLDDKRLWSLWRIFWEYGDIQGHHKWLTDLVELSNTSSSAGSKRSSYERNTTSFTTSLFESHDNKNRNKISI